MTQPSQPAPRAPGQTPSLDDFVAHVQKTFGTLYPRRVPARFTLVFEDGENISLLIPSRDGDTGQPTWHSSDFRHVRWYGTPYDFTLKQSAVMAILWRAWESGRPGVSISALMVEAESDSSQLTDLFRDHPAIVVGRCITRVKRGVYALEEPDNQGDGAGQN